MRVHGNYTLPMKALGVLFATLVVQASDATAQTTVVPLPIHQVWAAVRTVYAQFAIPVNLLRTANYQIGNRGYRPRRVGGERPSYYVDCGSGPGAASYADAYSVTMTVLTTLQQVGYDLTAITTVVTATAKPRDANVDPVPCTSRGTLEQQIAGLLATAP